MRSLKDAGTCNVLYPLAKAFGTMREDGCDTLLPTNRMPMDLLEYMAFFTTASVKKVYYFLAVCMYIS